MGCHVCRNATANITDAILKAEPAPDPEAGLTPTVRAFVHEYLRNNRNGTAAWLKASPACKTAASAATAAYEALRNPDVKALIRAEDERLREKFHFDRDEALRRFLEIALADPAELSQMRMVSCDSCWPKDAQEAVDAPAEGAEPEERGGRLSMWEEPNPACTHCHGHGIPRVWFADTRSLSPAGKALFQAAKVTKQGIQIELHSRLDALKEAAKIIGAYELDNAQKAANAVDALRDFFGALHGATRLPIAKPQGKAPPAGPGNPIVKG